MSTKGAMSKEASVERAMVPNSSSRIRLTSGLQEPQPVPAPVAAHNWVRSRHPAVIFFFIFPLPTLLQLHTNLPEMDSPFPPLRNNLRRFYFRPILPAISCL